MFRDDLRDLAKSSNGRKIARTAPISTIFGGNRSRRPDLVFRKFSRRPKNFRVVDVVVVIVVAVDV